nr:hypothetical protein [Tanacetum cinerariifolium]
MCDVPFRDNSPSLDISKDQFEDFSDSNDDSTLIDDDSFFIDDIEYVEESPLDSELILEVGGIDADILLTIKDDILCEKLLNVNLLIAKIKSLKDNPTPSFDFMTKSSSTSLNFLLEETNTFDNSLPESETFCLKRLVVAVPLLVLIILFRIMTVSMTIMLKRLVVALPLLILIFLFIIRSSLIFRSIYFLLPIRVIFMSSQMSSLTSYLHRSMIVSPLRMNPTRGISLWMWWRILFQQENREFMCLMFYPSIPPFN